MCFTPPTLFCLSCGIWHIQLSTRCTASKSLWLSSSFCLNISALNINSGCSLAVTNQTLTFVISQDDPSSSILIYHWCNIPSSVDDTTYQILYKRSTAFDGHICVLELAPSLFPPKSLRAGLWVRPQSVIRGTKMNESLKAPTEAQAELIVGHLYLTAFQQDSLEIWKRSANGKR